MKRTIVPSSLSYDARAGADVARNTMPRNLSSTKLKMVSQSKDHRLPPDMTCSACSRRSARGSSVVVRDTHTHTHTHTHTQHHTAQTHLHGAVNGRGEDSVSRFVHHKVCDVSVVVCLTTGRGGEWGDDGTAGTRHTHLCSPQLTLHQLADVRANHGAVVSSGNHCVATLVDANRRDGGAGGILESERKREREGRGDGEIDATAANPNKD